MPRSGGVLGRLQEAVEQRTGTVLVESGRLDLMEAMAKEGYALRRELDLLGWHVMDFLSGQPQELKFDERKKMAQQARLVWTQDPQAGSAIDLSNDFVFGRGVQRPNCRDEEVQKIVDEAWDDPDNQLVLTSFEAQVALNTDLEIQSNVFLVMFDDGEDGKVKLALLNHDTVESVVRDPDNRLRILYYMAKVEKQEWDFDNDRPKMITEGTAVFGKDGKRKVLYYRHWSNVEVAEEQEDREDPMPKPPPEKQGNGKVRHIAVNRTSEMAFGVPTMRRTMRWFTAYNDFMKARVDMAQAAAAFIMKRKIDGTPNQLAKLASRAVSRQSDLATSGEGAVAGPRGAAGILGENEAVTHENLNLNSGAGNAVQDGQMLRSQISASTHWPQHYLGDTGSANLATATSMELPVLKHVEGRQEVWEGVFRWFIDRVIEKAVDDGLLDEFVEDEEAEAGALGGAPSFPPPRDSGAPDPSPWGMGEAHEDAELDEEQTKRDLSYEFSMPNPLKRTMTDLVSAVTNVAKTFDPNNTNPELSRILLAVVLGEGLELEDPQGAVERVFPEGYEDPAIAAARQAQMGQLPPGAPGADGQMHTQANPYGAPMNGGLPEQVTEAKFTDLPEVLQLRGRARISDVERLFDEDVKAVADEALTGLVVASVSNGNGSH